MTAEIASPTPRATLALRDRYLAGLAQVFELYQAADPELRQFIGTTLLVGDATILLSGIYGTGKTQLVHLLRATFFTRVDGSDDFGYVTCTQDLTPLDTLFHLDLGRLTQGEEVALPRAIVGARFKFVNEVQRASSLVYNALLPLLSEKLVVYRDRVFQSPDFVCLLDANPLDAGSSEIPQAFKDRIDFSFDLPLISPAGMVALHRQVARAGGRWGNLAEHTRPAFEAREMDALWADVRRVEVPAEVELLAALIGASLQRCRAVDRARVALELELPCRDCVHRPEVCAKLAEVPGARFLISALKLAQARAWLRGNGSAAVDDLLYGLPYVLAHRLKVRVDSLRLYPSLAAWVKEELYRRGVRGKVPRWRQAIRALCEARTDDPLLCELAARDLAVEELVRSLETTPRALLP